MSERGFLDVTCPTCTRLLGQARPGSAVRIWCKTPQCRRVVEVEVKT